MTYIMFLALAWAQGERERGLTPLMEAVLRRDVAAVRSLLEAGADPNRADARGNTALHLAGSNSGVVRALLAAGADVDAANDEGVTALILSAQHDPSLVKLLLDAGADVSHRDVGGVSALTVAKKAGRDEIVALLREAGAEESMAERLHEAIRAGDRAEVRRLLEAGADADALDVEQFQPPLMTALESRRVEIVLDLLDAGADPTIEATGFETTGDNAIEIAALQRTPWVLRKLLERKARPEDLEAVLFLACDDAAMLRVALDLGAGPSVNARDARGRTPLICAAAAGSVDAVALLLEVGADLGAVSDEGLTAIQAARRAGHEQVARTLLAALTR